MDFQLSLRPALRSDCDAIARIAEATELFPGDMLGEMIAAYLAKTSEDIWLVAEMDGKVVGFASASPNA